GGVVAPGLELFVDPLAESIQARASRLPRPPVGAAVGPQVAAHGVAREARLLGDLADRLPLAVTLTDLLIPLDPPLPFGLSGLLACRRLARGSLEDRRRLGGLCQLAGRLLPRLIGRILRWSKWLSQHGRDRLDLATVTLEEAFEHLADVLEQVPAIGDLHGIGRGFGGGLGVGAGAVAADDLDTGVVLQPLLKRRAVAARQQVDDLAALEI